MNYRELGRTGLNVGAIGIGTEHMNRQPRETAVSTIHAAIEGGVNYFGIIFAMPEYLDNIKCLAYALAQPGVSLAPAGVRNDYRPHRKLADGL